MIPADQFLHDLGGFVLIVAFVALIVGVSATVSVTWANFAEINLLRKRVRMLEERK